MDPRCERLRLLRRQFLTSTAGGAGALALLSLLRETGVLASPAKGRAPKAKNCIFFFMEGGPSQFDLFSHKPKLNELHMKRPPEALLKGKRFAFIRSENAVLFGTPPERTFAPYGKSGMIFSHLIPGLARHADRICKIQTVFTNQFNHHPAQLVLQTGDGLDGGHPSIGSWFLYGLGSENKDLPGYVVLNSSRYLSGGSRLWQSGFLPTNYGGVGLQPNGDPVLNLAAPKGVSQKIERRGLDSLARLNEMHRQQMADPEISARIENYELAFRMQSAAPALVDLANESPETRARYGIERSDPTDVFVRADRVPTRGFANFARHCLLARRMVERGVRFVNVFSGSWDAHSYLETEIVYMSRMIDQPIAALVDDLAERGLLDETLIVIAGEFGRTPLGEHSSNDTVYGRDHHPDAFPILLIGGGVKGGLTFGETDELGWAPIRDAVDVADIHATLLHLFGLDHTKLTYPFRGAEPRLTPLTRPARVIDEILA
ncbi:MAG: DUF1501 domain-containing protein [Polyangiaceae bacterium]